MRDAISLGFSDEVLHNAATPMADIVPFVDLIHHQAWVDGGATASKRLASPTQ